MNTGKAIVVTSGKGGTGKTTAVASLSACLAILGHKTLCIDADTDLRNLDLCLGLSDSAAYDFLDVLSGLRKLDEAVLTHPRLPPLDFLPAPAFVSPDKQEGLSLDLIIAEAKEKYEFCLIDSPAGIGTGFQTASRCADMAIIVTTPDYTSYRDAARVNIELNELGISGTELIVNRVRPMLLGKMRTTIDDAMDFTGTKLLAVIPEDRRVILSLNSGTLLPQYSEKGASKAFMRAAKRLCGQKVSIGIR